MPHTDYTDTFPMWHGNTILFHFRSRPRASPEYLQLRAWTVEQIEQLTHFTEFDVMWPSLGPDAIIFENGGYLYLFDLATQQSTNSRFTCRRRDLAMKHGRT